MDLTPLLAPRSIAVLGATDRPDAYGNTILRNLEAIGFGGALWGINPGREAVRDIPCVPSIAALPEPVDALAVAVPAAAVPEAIEAAARRGCGGAVVVSAGFGEVAEGRELERLLREAALAADPPMPVCGPNGNGIVSVHERAALWGDSLRPLEAGGVALVSQSGNVAVNALGSRRATGFHTVVSTGNGAVCDAGDWLLALSERDGVRSIALFLESDGDGAKLAEGLARCSERDVRVVVLKVGSSGAGAAAAAAHTGALAGDQRAFRSLIEEAGASSARNPHELLELARVLAEPRAQPRARANAKQAEGAAGAEGGLAILTCSGGDSGNAADEADRLGVELPPLSAPTCERLAELLPGAATAGNPLDYTSLIWAETERLEAIVAAVAADPAIDQLLLFHDTPSDLSDEAAVGWAATRAGLAAGAAGDGGEGADPVAPLFASTLPDLISEDVIRELGAAGIASVGGLSIAVLCARELRRRGGDAERLRAIAAAAAAGAADTDADVGAGAGGGADGGAWLGEAEAKSLIAAAGITVPAGRLAADVEGCLTAADELTGPLVLKLSSPRIQHKSELGAIVVGIDDAAMLRSEAERLLALPAAAGAELLVEEMAAPGVELLVAASRDGVVPALVVGLGGIWTEALADVAVIPLPAAPERVERALRSLRGAALLTGGRGREPVDHAAVARAASAAGDLLLAENLELLELNPLIAGPDGCIAVDALARRR